MTTMTSNPVAVNSTLTLPALLLKLESAALALGALALYINRNGSGLLFLLLILVPDLSILALVANPGVGVALYDAVHTYTVHVMLTAIALTAGSGVLLDIALIWFVHISADRLMGFGLRYLTVVKESHLQRV